ncbi:DMT family transporter [Streptomyces kanamyceticus]|uniref:DMT family transporter n=1 Tax=Streptomyces kanamyceticus TaxID=1967 RepID=A0A5J6G5D6_STRKN|nr:DMT family transporter [Streptomyces kanamyceticus]QEU89804.1 DMT family transporter [Streptomyces kanamyceticus]
MPAAAAPWLLLAVFSGTLISLQARITGELAAGLGGDGFAAAVISFGSGFVLLALGLLVLRGPRRGVGLVLADVRGGRLKWWQVLGGFGGAAFLLAQGLTVGALGVALFTVAIVAGQVSGGLLFDRMGLGPAGPQRPSRRRVVGAMLVLVAVGLSMADKLGGGFPYAMLLLPLVAGVCVSWQQAVNGHVKNAAGSAYAGTFFNFVAGTGALSVIFLVHAAAQGLPDRLPTEPYVYLGGLVGISFITIAVAAVQKLGVLLLGLCTITGQLVGSLALDLLLPHGDTRVTAATVAGVALALAAVAVAALAGPRAGRVVASSDTARSADADADAGRVRR